MRIQLYPAKRTEYVLQNGALSESALKVLSYNICVYELHPRIKHGGYGVLGGTIYEVSTNI